ncbi:MAG: hypothetical protein WDO70_11850 [Alphaproteobacteria bacterium]
MPHSQAALKVQRISEGDTALDMPRHHSTSYAIVSNIEKTSSGQLLWKEEAMCDMATD